MDHNNNCLPSTSIDDIDTENKAKAYSFLHGNELAQKFVQNVHNYFQVWHPQLNTVQETTKALEISDFSVRRYKDGPVENRLVVSKKRTKPLTDDLREGVRLEIRDEIYSMCAELAEFYPSCRKMQILYNKGLFHYLLTGRQEQKDALDSAAAAGSLLYGPGIDDSMYGSPKPRYKNSFTGKHYKVSSPSKSLVNAYKYSSHNSTGTRRLDRFLKEYSQKTCIQPLSNDSPKQKVHSEILTKPNKRSTLKTYKYKETKTSKVKTCSSSEKSTSSSKTICRKSKLDDYFREIKKNIKNTNDIEKKSLSRVDSIVTVTVGSISEKDISPSISEISGVSNEYLKGCARTKTWPELAVVKKESNSVSVKEKNSEHSSLSKALKFIEEFDKEYQRSKSSFVDSNLSKSPWSHKKMAENKNKISISKNPTDVMDGMWQGNITTWMKKVNDPWNSQNKDREQNTSTLKRGYNSTIENNITTLDPPSQRKTQRNLYSSEGFCELMSQTPTPKIGSYRQSYLCVNHTEKCPNSFKAKNSQQSCSGRRSIKRTPFTSIRETEKFNEFSSFITSLCSQTQKHSSQPVRRKLTPSEEKELSPDFYVRKMCGLESEELVKKILNSHKKEDEAFSSDIFKAEEMDPNNLLPLPDSDVTKIDDSENKLNLKGILVSEKDSPSGPLSFGSPSIILSGSQINKNTTFTNVSKVSPQNDKVLDNKATKTIKKKCNKSKEHLTTSLHINPKTKISNITQNNSNLTQTMESLYKLHESNSWSAQERTETGHIFPHCSTKNNKGIKKNTPVKDKVGIGLPLLETTPKYETKVTKQNTTPSEIFGTLNKSNIFSTPDLTYTSFSSNFKTKECFIINADDSKDAKNSKRISEFIQPIESVDPSRKTYNDPFLHKRLMQNCENIVNIDSQGVGSNIKCNNIQQREKDVYHITDNCDGGDENERHDQINYDKLKQETNTQTQTELLTEDILGTQNTAKKMNKTYNITENCVLYNDNLLKDLIKDNENNWKISEQKNVLRREAGEEPLNYGRSYIKRYKKGVTKIFKIKRRIKREEAKAYRPPESQVMDRFFEKLDQGFREESSSTTDSIESNEEESVSTPLSYKTDETKSEVLSTGSCNLTPAEKLLRQGINKLCKDRSLLFSKFEDSVPDVFDKYEIIANIDHIIKKVLEDFEGGNNPAFKIPKEDISNCFFADGRYQIREPPEYTTVSYKNTASRTKFNLILFLLNKVKKLLETDSKLTKRELYYQLKPMVTSQGTTDRALKDISRILNVGMWALNVTAQKGLVYGNLKLIMTNGEIMNCNVPGTLIPQDISKICEVQSTAYFILVVEKESIFHKLLEENLPNKLTRPFILITGKGFPDLNTQLFLKKLWMIMSIPVFILVDADPHGIAIMLNYRFGSIANAHVSKYLAIPKARWLGVFPSEILRLSFSYENLKKREICMTHKLLQLQCVQENKNIQAQLEKLLENGIKTGIEGLIKIDKYLSNSYLCSKFFTNNLI